jgi:hypothetical protein
VRGTGGEWRASSSERFQLELFANDGHGGREVMAAKRIGPFQNAWVRASIPLEYFRKPAREGFDLAATFNKHRESYWININFGSVIPAKNVTAIGFQMDAPYPVDGKAPTLEIRSVKLAKDDPGDAVLEPAKLVDQFGQWIPAEWAGKAKSLEDLKKAWTAEDAALKPGDFGYDKYGGYAASTAKATGFFHAEQVNGKWWFVDPEGHLFYSNGVNGIGTSSTTPAARRANIFESGVLSGSSGPATMSQFDGYGSNLALRFANTAGTIAAGAPPIYRDAWGQFTFRRLDAWGFNTVAGFASAPNPSIALSGNRKPYTIMLRNWAGGGPGATTIMGMPDVYAPDFEQRVDAAAAQQCDPYKTDPYLLGYFLGNEPPWPGRESLFCDAVLAGPDSTMKFHLIEALGPGDTPENRKKFVYDTFNKYLATITAAVKKHDPNHLTLGIRLGGEVPDEVIEACNVFDVCSINVYDWSIDSKFLDKVVKLTERPIVVGEFHFGAPTHGLSGGLRQVASQKDRGLAYAYYVEHAAAHPNVIGTHWFQWLDQPATGRNDGENYNIGLIDVTDQPYAELVSAMAATHKRIFDIHTGKTPPTDKLPEGRSTAEYRAKTP